MTGIRNAEAADLETILAIYNDAVLNTTAVYDFEPRTMATQQQWFETKCRSGYPVLVAVEQEKVLGFASYGPFRPWPAYLHTMENSIYVAPGQRGRGIGTALLGPLVAAARDGGFHALVAGIDATNEASLRLHARLGFEKVAHFREVGRKFDRWLDLVFFERML